MQVDISYETEVVNRAIIGDTYLSFRSARKLNQKEFLAEVRNMIQAAIYYPEEEVITFYSMVSDSRGVLSPEFSLPYRDNIDMSEVQIEGEAAKQIFDKYC